MELLVVGDVNRVKGVPCWRPHEIYSAEVKITEDLIENQGPFSRKEQTILKIDYNEINQIISEKQSQSND